MTQGESTELRCHVCGERATLQITGVVDYLSEEKFDLVRCEKCRLTQIDPMPSDEIIGRYYPARYRVKRHGVTDELRRKLRAKAVKRYFPKDFKGRLLDVGCGDGSFVLHMKNEGWEVGAVEIDPAPLARLREQGVDARQAGEAMEKGFDRPFDAITCWHVLEHVIDPARQLKWMRESLAVDGIVQIAVPNLASWQAKWFGRHWLHLDVPRHRYHFTRQTLTTLLEQAGLEAVEWKTFALEYDWFGFIQSALNKAGMRPNVFFEKLTSGSTPPGAGRDAVISFLLAPFIAAFTLPPCILSAFCGTGATLTVTCRRRG